VEAQLQLFSISPTSVATTHMITIMFPISVDCVGLWGGHLAVAGLDSEGQALLHRVKLSFGSPTVVQGRFTMSIVSMVIFVFFGGSVFLTQQLIGCIGRQYASRVERQITVSRWATRCLYLSIFWRSDAIYTLLEQTISANRCSSSASDRLRTERGPYEGVGIYWQLCTTTLCGRRVGVIY